MDMFNYFIEKSKINNNKLWLRQVIIPTINDNEEYVLQLKDYTKQFNKSIVVQYLSNVKLCHFKLF